MKRALLENNPKYKQPIVYCIIVNPSLRQVFVYQRSKQDKRYHEKRLKGRWSFGIGGHVEKLDIEKGHPILVSMLRELKEEVEIPGSVNPKLLGYINDDKDEVGKVHFGVLYVIETDSAIITPKDPEIGNGRLRTINELDKICSSSRFIVERWSRISFKPLKLYLQKLE